MKKVQRRKPKGRFGKKVKNLSEAKDLIKSSPWRTTGGAFIRGLTPLPAQWESYLERFSVSTLALCSDVISIVSQPFTEEYLDSQGIKRSYTPDYLVVLTDRSELLLEVKSLRHLVIDESLSKYIDIANHIKPKKKFRFLVDTQLEECPRFKTVKLLFRYVTSNIREDTYLKVEAILSSTNTGISIRELIEKAEVELVDVYTLIAKRKLCIDWNASLDDQAEVSLPNKPFEGLSIEKILASGQHGDFLEKLALGYRSEDKRLISLAKVGRQYDHPPNPFRVICGFSQPTPLDGVQQAERPTRKSWDRRDEAIGNNPLPKKDSDEEGGI